jgi:cell division protein FtsZ
MEINIKNQGIDTLANSVFSNIDEYSPRILVVGAGGAGNNTINRLVKVGITGAQTIALNTDKQHLDMIDADKRILIGKQVTKGLGSGGDPDVGKRCGELARDSIEAILKDADIVFITAGLGGGTGTGTAPLIAEVAKEMGSVVIALVSFPFYIEKRRIGYAKEGLLKLKGNCDSLLILDNNRLLALHPELPIDEAFRTMDGILSSIIKGITETITVPSLINLDYADVRTVMLKEGQIAALMFGEGSIYMPEDIIQETLNNKFISVKHKGAKGALIHITGGPDMSLTLINELVEGLTKDLAKGADVIFGARVDPDLRGQIKIMAVLTGVHQRFEPCPVDKGKSKLLETKRPRPNLGIQRAIATIAPDKDGPHGINWIK